MGLFGHGGFFSKVGHAIEDAVSDTTEALIDKPLHWINKQGEKIFGDDPYYVGYNSNSGPVITEGEQAKQIIANGGISGSIGSDLEHPSGAGTIGEIENRNNQGYIYNNIGKNPNTYKGNTAKTADSIKQGGMTKDDLIAYNQKHPNETAGTSGSMKTSFNSNIATKRY